MSYQFRKIIKKRKPTKIESPSDRLVNVFDKVITEITNNREVKLFLVPDGLAHDHEEACEVIRQPMTLVTLRQNNTLRKYRNSESFVKDVKLILNICLIRYGPASEVTLAAQKMIDVCLASLEKKKDVIQKLEMELRQPQLHNCLKELSNTFASMVIYRMKKVFGSGDFYEPINGEEVVDYYRIVEEPMALNIILKKVRSHVYTNRCEFLSDVELLFNNSDRYNGTQHYYTDIARNILMCARQACKEVNHGARDVVVYLV